METSVMLQAMRDPMGLPFYPMVFQGLGILTFSLHIFFVNLVLGGALLAAWGYFKKEGPWLQLSQTLAKVTTIHISIAIVLGVAPLLFIQVIYDPFWYTSNVLSAWWTILFLVALVSGALSIYAFYLKRKPLKNGGGILTLVACACFLFAAVIIHMLSMQVLHPEQWLTWYINHMTMDTSGWGFHAVSLSRLFHFLIPALLNIGIFLMLYAWFFFPREDLDKSYLRWVARLGLNLSRTTAVVTAAIGLWWLWEIPKSFDFWFDHSLIAGVVLSIVLILILFKAGSNPMRFAPAATLASLLTILVMALSRESLRMHYLQQFDYSVRSYPVTLDWGSTLLFIGTLAIGIIVLAYLVCIAFKSGRHHSARPIEKPINS